MTDLVPSWDDPEELVPRTVRIMQRAGGPYVAAANIGPCRRCGFREDRRLGACFECAERIDGIQMTEHVHILWDRTNPSNTWMIWLREV